MMTFQGMSELLVDTMIANGDADKEARARLIARCRFVTVGGMIRRLAKYDIDPNLWEPPDESS